MRILLYLCRLPQRHTTLPTPVQLSCINVPPTLLPIQCPTSVSSRPNAFTARRSSVSGASHIDRLRVPATISQEALWVRVEIPSSAQGVICGPCSAVTREAYH